MNAKTIFLCAGHGGNDQGVAVGQNVEGQLAVQLRDSVAKLLKARGYSVLRDGIDGQNLPLADAIKMIKGANGVKVDIHFNASSNKDATGIEALAHPSEKKLAQSLCKALALATGLKLRGESGYKSASSGQHSRLGFCDAGGVVLEVCFLTNPADFEAYKSAFNGVSEALANALALAAQGKGV